MIYGFQSKNVIITNNILKFIHYGTNIPVGDDHPPLNYRDIKEEFRR
jgi:hypothetical protein